MFGDIRAQPGQNFHAPILRLHDHRLAIHDPWAVRGLVAVMAVAAYVAAGDERTLRVASAFDWNGVLTPTNIRVDAWVTPPVYTGKPPIILSSANKESALPASSRFWIESVIVPPRPRPGTCPTARFERDVPEMLRSP